MVDSLMCVSHLYINFGEHPPTECWLRILPGDDLGEECRNSETTFCLNKVVQAWELMSFAWEISCNLCSTETNDHMIVLQNKLYSTVYLCHVDKWLGKIANKYSLSDSCSTLVGILYSILKEPLIAIQCLSPLSLFWYFIIFIGIAFWVNGPPCCILVKLSTPSHVLLFLLRCIQLTSLHRRALFTCIWISVEC